MDRFRGQDLPDRPRLAVITNDALGNYVVSTPLLAGLRARYPDARIAYFGGVRTRELWSADPKIHEGHALFGSPPREVAALVAGIEPFDLVINLEVSYAAKTFATALARGYVCGPALAPDSRGDWAFPEGPEGDLWRDPAWIAPDLAARHPVLESGFIGEIFYRACGLSGPLPGYDVPRAEADPGVDVLIAMSASLPEKLWPLDAWRVALAGLRDRGLSVGLLGAPPKTQATWRGGDAEGAVVAEGLARDLRGRFSLPEVVGAISRARAVLTLDNGILHLAGSTDTPVVGLFREGIHRLWCPPRPNVRPVVPAPGEPVAALTPARVLAEFDHAV